MSLLLDALNRASKDRAAADAAAPLPVTAGWPTIALQTLPTPPPVEPAAQPSLSPFPEPTAPAAAGTVLSVAAGKSAPSSLRLEPMFIDTPAQAPVAAGQPPDPGPAVSSSPAPEPEPEPVSPAFVAKPADPVKVARNMMRAKEANRVLRPPRQRLLALGGAAGLLSLSLAGLWLGWLSPLALPGQPVSPAPIASTAPSVNPAPLPAPATVVGSAESPSNAAATTSDPLAAMPAKPKTAALPVSAAVRAGRRAAEGLTSATAPSTAAAAKPTELPNLLASMPSGASPLELAYAALMQGRLADAEAGYKQVLKSSPEERDALLGLAYIAHQEGRGEGARDFYKQVLRQEPGNPTARAGLLMQSLSSQTEDASVGARNLAEQHPAAAAAQSVLGHSLVRQGRLADAQMAFQRAHVLEPSVALHAFNLAVAFDRLKNYAAASRLYERALSLSTQGGGAAASGLVHAVVQKRLQELGLVGSPNPPATN